METVGERIRWLRKQRGWTQQELGAILGNRSKNSISLIENNKRRVSQYTLAKLAETFGVPGDYLLCRSDDPHPERTISEEKKALLTMRMPDDTYRDWRIRKGDELQFVRQTTLEDGAFMLVRIDRGAPTLRKVEASPDGDDLVVLVTGRDLAHRQTLSVAHVQALARLLRVSFTPA